MNDNEVEGIRSDILERGKAFAQFGSLVFENIASIFRQAYYKAGVPYGYTEEGYTRWLDELEKSIPDYRRHK